MKDGMGKVYSLHGREKNAHMALVVKPEGKRPRGRWRHNWEGNN
jgi:hypothetical protein